MSWVNTREFKRDPRTPYTAGVRTSESRVNEFRSVVRVRIRFWIKQSVTKVVPDSGDTMAEQYNNFPSVYKVRHIDVFFGQILFLCRTLERFLQNVFKRCLVYVYESFLRRVENVFLIKVFLIYEGSSGILFIRLDKTSPY